MENEGRKEEPQTLEEAAQNAIQKKKRKKEPEVTIAPSTGNGPDVSVE